MHIQGRSRMRTGGANEDPPRPLCPANGHSHQSHTIPQDAPMSVQFTWHGHSNSVLSVLNQMRLHRELTDVELVVEELKIPAHKTVLVASSPYFRAMFTSSYSETSQRSVEILGMTPEALELLVNYFYTSEINISTYNVEEIFAVSCMLQVTPIRDACCQFMRRHLGVSNCLGVSAFADVHSCPELKQVADDIARKNFVDVVNSEEFMRLHVDQVMELFSANTLNVSSEEKVFESVIAWIKYDPAEREKYVLDLLAKVSV